MAAFSDAGHIKQRTRCKAQKPGPVTLVQSGQAVDVWDLCLLADVERAAALTASSDHVDAMALGLRAAAACSSAARLTPLHVAASSGQTLLVQRLLSIGAPVNARNKTGQTALFQACEEGHANVTELLLTADADIWCRTASGESALYIAALRGHESVRYQLYHRFRCDYTQSSFVLANHPSAQDRVALARHVCRFSPSCCSIVRTTACAGRPASNTATAGRRSCPQS